MIVPIVHPKELRLKQLRKEAEMQPGATHQGEGTCGLRGTCLIPGPVWVGLCSKSQQPTEHSWKRQSHRTGVKVALPDFSS